MELYWKLASGDASVREEAAVALVRDLLQSQQQQEKGAHAHKEEGDAPHHHHFSNNYHQAAEEVLLGASAEDEGLPNCTPAVQYALRRLVRGVASSRESARQGFAMALASVLEALPLVRVDYVVKLIKKSLEVTSSMKGQEKRDGLLGQLFALGAVVRSGRLVADDEDTKHANLARDIAEQLLSLANKKVFLREPAITVLLHLIDKLPPCLLQDSVLSSSLLQETLCMDMENASADSLLLALRLKEQLPTSVVESCPLLPNSRSTHALFEPSHLLSLLPVLKDSSSCHPRVHPVWSTLIELLFLDSNAEGRRTPSKKMKRRKIEGNEAVETVDQRVVSFWTLVVDKSLLTSSHERKYLAMELLQLVLVRLSAQSAGFVLSRTLVRCVLDVLADKGNLLYKSAQRCLEFICEWAKADEQCLVAVILSLQQGSHGKFDTLSKTQTVKQLVAMLKSKQGCFLLYDKLVELFNGKKRASFAAPQLQLLSNGSDDQYGPERDERKEREKLGTDGVKSGEFQRYLALDQICSFVKQIHMEPELRVSLQKEVLKFLTVNALFVGSSGVKCTVPGLQEEVKFPEVPISENIRKLCLARLQSVLVDVLPTASLVKDNKNTAGKDELVQKTSGSSDLRFFFLELCDMLDKIPRVTRVQPVSEDDKDAINALQSCVSQLHAVIQKAENEQSQKIQAMCSLLMQLLLQSVTAHVNEIAAELIICCERAFGELIEVDAKGGDEEEEDSPVFMDVLVDILLSLLAQASAPIRAAAEKVFKSFCGDLTESAMLSLLRVVKKQLRPARRLAATPLDVGDSDEDQFLEVEDSDEDMNDDDDHVNMDDNTEKPKGKELHTPDSDTENDVKGGEGNQSQNTGDQDSETSKDNSDSDMDDEAMFRIDTHLANLLKQKGAVGDKGEGKDAQTQLLHFKFRVLSLVEYFFQKKSSSPLCLTALPHLLQAFVSSCSVGGNSQLAGRIGSILQMKLFKSKQYPKGQEVDKASVEGFLQRCVKLVSRSKVKKVREVAQSCSLWLVKVLHGQPLQEGDERENLRGIIQDAMNDFFSQKKSHLKAPFFRELFMRFPGLGMANLGLLLDRCVNSRSEYLQHEALLLVKSILHFNIGKESGQFRECLMQHLPALSGVLVGLIEKPPSKGPMKSEAHRFCLSLLKVLSQELPEKRVKKLIGKPAYNLCLSHFGASVVENILKSQVVSVVPDSHNARDTSKRLSKQKSGHK